ncbi:hypothetical protein D1841_08690 [Neglecta sp. X4]|nr:hypothetical protein [Neglectibacter sp. 59]NBJ73375.1 hypothetical protein [Neglectibacter sp. X4]NCE82170.1 hypothetical protein [Neglectibacter sp. X58]
MTPSQQIQGFRLTQPSNYISQVRQYPSPGTSGGFTTPGGFRAGRKMQAAHGFHAPPAFSL